jgi:hypothetical protein
MSKEGFKPFDDIIMPNHFIKDNFFSQLGFFDIVVFRRSLRHKTFFLNSDQTVVFDFKTFSHICMSSDGSVKNLEQG